MSTGGSETRLMMLLPWTWFLWRRTGPADLRAPAWFVVADTGFGTPF